MTRAGQERMEIRQDSSWLHGKGTGYGRGKKNTEKTVKDREKKIVKYSEMTRKNTKTD
jgi:hypothetical protein